jgi:hypothetical protein
MRYITTALLLFLLLSSCQSSSEEEDNKARFFFSLENYFEEEISRLNREQPTVSKRITLKGKEEVEQFDTLDYQKELTAFSKADINKVAWQDKYQADTTYSPEGKMQRISYEAKDDKLKTQKISIQFTKEGEVEEIYIKSVNESFVADVYKELYYKPATGYRFESQQSTNISKPTVVEVEARFIE